MIPKIIHYCWFGKAPKTRERECLLSWRILNSDYEIKEWNEETFDINVFDYTREAYAQQCWSKVSNFVRLWALYNYGGIYLDTDVKVVRSLDALLYNECFFGIEYTKRYPFYEESFFPTLFGTAIIGSIQHHETIGRILEWYKTKQFDTFERTPESNNVLLITNLFKQDILNNCTVYGRNVLYPDQITGDSYTIHLKFDSWAKDRI